MARRKSGLAEMMAKIGRGRSFGEVCGLRKRSVSNDPFLGSDGLCSDDLIVSKGSTKRTEVVGQMN